MSRVISVIGAGRIGGEVIRHIELSPRLRLGRVLTRQGAPDTGDLDVFLATRADVIIDAAGPVALSRYGLACLAQADLWSVGAAALVDARLLGRMQETARRAETRLRLFAPWAFGIGTAPPSAITNLTLRIVRDREGPDWSGPLDVAAALFPGEVNFAVAASLAGPGIAAARVEFAVGQPGTHRIEAVCTTEAGTYASSVDFKVGGCHPTAPSLIAGLRPCPRQFVLVDREGSPAPGCLTAWSAERQRPSIRAMAARPWRHGRLPGRGDQLSA